MKCKCVVCGAEFDNMKDCYDHAENVHKIIRSACDEACIKEDEING